MLNVGKEMEPLHVIATKDMKVTLLTKTVAAEGNASRVATVLNILLVSETSVSILALALVVNVQFVTFKHIYLAVHVLRGTQETHFLSVEKNQELLHQ